MPDNKVTVVIAGEDQTSGVFSKVTESLSGMAEKLGGLKEIFEALAIEEVVRRLAEFAAETLKDEVELVKLSEKTGIAIEDLSSLSVAAQMAGMSNDELSHGLQKFATVISEAAAGNAKAKQTLDAAGVSARDANGHIATLTAGLNQVANKFGSTKDSTEKAALAVQLFGKQGLSMIPVLDQGSKGLDEMRKKAEDLHLALTKADEEALKEFDDQLGLAKLAAKGLAQSFDSGLLPSLNAVLKAMNDSAGGFDLMRFFGLAAGAAIRGIATALLTVGAVISTGVEKVLAFFHVIKDAGDSLGDKLKKIWTDIWDPAVAKEGEEKQKGNIQRLAEDAEKIWKAALQNKMDQQKLAEDFAKSIDTIQLQRLQELYAQNLVTVQDYYAKKNKLQQDDLQAQLYAAQQQKQILENALKSAPNPEEKLSVQRQINDLIEKETVLQAQLNELQGKDFGGGADPLLQKARDMQMYGEEAAKLGQQIDDVFAQLAEDTKKVQDAVENYQITALQGEKQLNAERAKAKSQLSGMIADYDALAEKSGDPKLLKTASQYGAKFDEIGVKFDSLRKDIIQGATSDLDGFFTSLLDGSQKGSNAFAAFGQSLLKTIDQIIAKMLAMWVVEQLIGLVGGFFGGGSGGGGGAEGGFSALAGSGIGDVGGGSVGGNIPFFASGGMMEAGSVGVVGDAGPELFIPNTAGAVISNSDLASAVTGGGGNTYNIDARGAQAGVSKEILNALRLTEERAVQRAKFETLDFSLRRP